MEAVMEQIRVSRRFLLVSFALAPAIPIVLSHKPERKRREDILKQLAITTWTWRMFRGLTQENLAARCGYARELQKEVEKGKHNITLYNLERLADGLDCK